MSTHVYNEILSEVLDQVKQLTPEEQLRLLEDLASIVRQRLADQPKHSVMEFRGVAKKFWEGIDVEKFIDEERNSWDG